MGSDLQPMVRVLFYDHNLGMLVLKDFAHAHVCTRTRTHIQKTHRVGNPAVAAPEGTCCERHATPVLSPFRSLVHLDQGLGTISPLPAPYPVRRILRGRHTGDIGKALPLYAFASLARYR